MSCRLNGREGASKDHFLQFQILYRLLAQDTAVLYQFQSGTHDHPSEDTIRFQLVFVLSYSPVLKTVPVRNGINPANAGKNPPSIFILWANDVF